MWPTWTRMLFANFVKIIILLLHSNIIYQLFFITGQSVRLEKLTEKCEIQESDKRTFSFLSRINSTTSSFAPMAPFWTAFRPMFLKSTRHFVVNWKTFGYWAILESRVQKSRLFLPLFEEYIKQSTLAYNGHISACFCRMFKEKFLQATPNFA